MIDSAEGIDRQFEPTPQLAARLPSAPEFESAGRSGHFSPKLRTMF
jgi:hypothetical protein